MAGVTWEQVQIFRYILRKFDIPNYVRDYEGQKDKYQIIIE